ncbi:MAG: coenzyme F420-0:L-glutamate ligase [Candidatus Staskawiczbacteria bacterium]|nr:coenzyme F420-0:L-glutamate ligase [Candidatus Staskawiczbacteria bacterium]
MKVKAIKTRKIIPPQDDLLSVIKQSFSRKPGIREKSIVVITSKVVSIWKGDCVKIPARNASHSDAGGNQINKDKLVKQQAGLYLESTHPKYNVMLTIKNNILIPTSGIDESNANGYYILWPKKPFECVKEIYDFIKKEFKLKSFGVIISDSHTTPLRTGIIGIGISYYGFYPLRDYRNKKDIFGRKLKMSQTNIIDSLSAAAVYEMGEGAEQTPIAVIEDVGNIKFIEKDFSKSNPLSININEDIYSPLLKSAKWKKGSSR